jgi:hypothetical protein
VTIRAGAPFALFDINGSAAGVDQLTAQAGDRFEVAHSNIQVLGSTRGLSIERLFPLEILFGDPRERLRTGEAGKFLPYSLYFYVSDDNQLFYEGVRVRFTASGDGEVVPAIVESDESGLVIVDWKLATQRGPNTLRVEVEGSEREPVVVEAVGVIVPPRQRNLFDLIFGR